jgi:hypothetical protein
MQGERPKDAVIQALGDLRTVIPGPVDGRPAGGKLVVVIDAGPVRFPSSDRAEVGICVTVGALAFEDCTHHFTLVNGRWRYSPKDTSCVRI